MEPDPVGSLPSILCLGLDGTGIPMSPEELVDRPGKQADGSSRTREVKHSTLCSAQKSDFKGIPVRDEGSATNSAAIESAASKETQGERSEFPALVLQETTRRQFGQVKTQVAIGDGAHWIWNIVGEHFPHATQILDLFHAKEHLGTVGKEIYGSESERSRQGIKARHEELDSGKIDENIGALMIYTSYFNESRKCKGTYT